MEFVLGFAVALVRPHTVGERKEGRRRGKGKRISRDEVLDEFCEDGEIWAAVRRLGPDRFPTLFRLDSHSSHTFDSYWIELMLAEIDRIEGSGLTAAESEIFVKLRNMGKSCLLEGSLVMRFTGD
ncbi:hypothetical protein [Kitasatospora sp. NPDC057223]|uniref:hypothetical protein n=1 Tax=Kitasatospora sp. NPDC057223 TaxID=3346055 RepID=UPI003644F7F5